jgi:hypothetical protein
VRAHAYWLVFTSKLVPARFTKLLRRDLNLLQLPLWQKVPPLKEVDFELIIRRVDRLPGSPFGAPGIGTLHVPLLYRECGGLLCHCLVAPLGPRHGRA